MSHVDEGLIHAWIDGAFEPDDPEGAAIAAHIDACAECRANVETARRLNARAAEILGRAAPDAVRVEPFERIVNARRARQMGSHPESLEPIAELVGGTSPDTLPGTDAGAAGGTRARRKPHIPLAWAASIMVAVTAGWFANTMLRPDRAGPPMSASFEATRAAAPGAPTESSEQDRANEAATEAAVVDAAAVQGDGAGTREAPLTRQAGRSDANEQRRERAAADAGAAAAAPPPAALKVAESVFRDTLSALIAEAEQEARTQGAELSLLRSAVLSDWSTVTIAEAASRFGRMPFAIEGVPIESVEIRETNGLAMVRVRQRVAPDAEVEIVQQSVAVSLDELVVTGSADTARRAAAGRAIAESANRAEDRPATPIGQILAAGDTSAVRVPLIGYTVVLRGALPADSLRSLAARVR
jgi:hypothetical protein